MCVTKQFDDEMKTNLAAAYASSGRGLSPLVQGDRSQLAFELAFNISCSLIDQGRHAEARQYLDSAKGPSVAIFQCNLLFLFFSLPFF